MARPKRSREATQAIARWLNRAMVERHLSQTDLARKATTLLPGGKTFSSDNISKYLRGVNTPTEATLQLLSRALEVDPPDVDLLMEQEAARHGEVEGDFSMQSVGNGMCYIQVKQVVPFAVAAKIAALLNEAEAGSNGAS